MHDVTTISTKIKCVVVQTIIMQRNYKISFCCLNGSNHHKQPKT